MMLTNFLLFKIGKFAVYIGPYRLAFDDLDDLDDLEQPIITEEDN